MDQLHALRQRTSHTTRQLFRGPPAADELEFLAEDEQEELIEALKTSNEKINVSFKLILLGFSAVEMIAHIGFAVYGAWSRTRRYMPVMDKDFQRSQSIAPGIGTFFSLASYGIGMLIIHDTKRITRTNLAGWTFISIVPLALALFGSIEWTFEVLWWSMPLMLQTLDLASLWIMQDPDEAFVRLESSRYKLKGA
ncbi:hypothetical protein BGZ94_008200 [Podila epigama]|nr:hypothetical protein BGZ94_008200 [Podila epigama]